MQGFVVGLLTFVSAAPTVEAQEVDPFGEKVHVVNSGDTLWDLAGRYLNDPLLWPEIYGLNRGSISNPDRIYPAARLILPTVSQSVTQVGTGGREEAASSGKPVEINEADGSAAQGERGGSVASGLAGWVGSGATGSQPAEATLSAAGSAGQAATGQRLHGSAGDAQAPAPRAQTPVPVAAVPRGSFYGASLLVPETEIASIGELFDVVSSTSVPRGVDAQIHPYDRVLIRLSAGASAAPGERVHLLRAGRYLPPHGRVFHATGQGVVLQIVDGTATVEVDRLYARIQKGDLVQRLPVYQAPVGMAIPASGLDGTLLELADPQPVSSIEDLAFVDLGESSGVSLGDEFEVYLSERASATGVRPEVVVGRLQVVRTTPTTSTVRVVSLEQPLLAPGLPVRLISRLQ